MQLFNSRGLTKKGVAIAIVLGLLTPKIVHCDNINKADGQEMFLPVVVTALRVIVQLMTIKVAEDVLVGYLGDKYGEQWEEFIKTQSRSGLAKIASTASSELKNITIGNEKISIGDFNSRYK